jgi:acyl-CoA synthetase (NDP forming)
VEEAVVRSVEDLIAGVLRDGRHRLFEHEVYTLVRLVSGIDPPDHFFVEANAPLHREIRKQITSERVVIKVVSPEVVHKSDAQGIAFCPNDFELIEREIARLLSLHAHRTRVDGVLVVESVEREPTETQGLGRELFVGLRSTREFGPVLAAGLGGTNAEYLASKLKPGRAVVRSPTAGLSSSTFFKLFTRTVAYDILSGSIRGNQRAIADTELTRCFEAFITIANRLCRPRDEGPSLVELEINPFAVQQRRLIPLDGRGRLGQPTQRPPDRPAARVRNLLEPRSMAVIGVSGTNSNSFGRIILRNIIGSGFDPTAVRVIKKTVGDIDGVECIPSISSLAEPIDLLVVAAGATEVPSIIDECVESQNVHSAVLISGVLGEIEGSAPVAGGLACAVARARRLDGGPVFLGPNSMGLQSRPGGFDTFFIPSEKLAKRWDAPHRGVAIVSQSGAFIVRTMSSFESLDPAFAVSVGNQADLTLSDLVRPIGDRPDIHTIGVYAEGFNDLDGLDLCGALADITKAGKTVVFYKGGRTPSGRTAAAGHTASLAGDYDVCRDAVMQAGALVAEDFGTFSQLLEVATMTQGLPVRGTRIGAVTNAGCEAVSMGDQAGDSAYSVVFPTFSDKTRVQFRELIATHRLSGLVMPSNPLDLTPMAGEQAYLDATRTLLGDEEIDAVIVSCVPATPAVPSTESELAAGSMLTEGLARLRDHSGKPVVLVVDAGPRYQALVSTLRDEGFAVLPSADAAVHILGRVLLARTRT